MWLRSPLVYSQTHVSWRWPRSGDAIDILKFLDQGLMGHQFWAQEKREKEVHEQRAEEVMRERNGGIQGSQRVDVVRARALWARRSGNYSWC